MCNIEFLNFPQLRNLFYFHPGKIIFLAHFINTSTIVTQFAFPNSDLDYGSEESALGILAGVNIPALNMSGNVFWE